MQIICDGAQYWVVLFKRRLLPSYFFIDLIIKVIKIGEIVMRLNVVVDSERFSASEDALALKYPCAARGCGYRVRAVYCYGYLEKATDYNGVVDAGLEAYITESGLENIDAFIGYDLVEVRGVFEDDVFYAESVVTPCGSENSQIAAERYGFVAYYSGLVQYGVIDVIEWRMRHGVYTGYGLLEDMCETVYLGSFAYIAEIGIERGDTVGFAREVIDGEYVFVELL